MAASHLKVAVRRFGLNDRNRPILVISSGNRVAQKRPLALSPNVFLHPLPKDVVGVIVIH